MLNILEKVIGNIVKNPTEQKYRNVKKGNKVLQKKLFVHANVDKVLEIMGFAYDSDDQVFMFYEENTEQLNDYLVIIDGFRVEIEAYYNNLNADPEQVR